MKIGRFDLDRDVLVVAEIGNNHEGSFDLAAELIGLASEAGAHAVKFQTFRTEHYVSRADAARFERLKRFELSFDQFAQLARIARGKGLLFLSTPFDLVSARFLDGIVDAFKIASGDITFVPLLEVVAFAGKPILLSTGMATMEEIRDAKAVIERIWRRKKIEQEVALLHCVSSYPVPEDQVNLAAITRLRRAFECTIGYSDHALGIEAAALSVAMGARIVEKHFTIRRDYSEFRDHQLSADPVEMAALVRRIHQVVALMGDGAKEPQQCERGAIAALRRSIAAAVDLPAGAILRLENLTWVRPGGGLPPGQEHLLLGRTLVRAVSAGEPITNDVLVETDQPCASPS